MSRRSSPAFKKIITSEGIIRKNNYTEEITGRNNCTVEKSFTTIQTWIFIF